MFLFTLFDLHVLRPTFGMMILEREPLYGKDVSFLTSTPPSINNARYHEAPLPVLENKMKK